MAFLNPVRLTFSGQFQADVSTVNNDVRHYDDAGFRPSFQQLQTKANANGWWNPTGSGAFRFVNCRVTGVGYADGSSCADSTADPAVGLVVAGAGDRTAGKLVDIDPQWQLASAPWGLAVRLLAGDRPALGGEYLSNAFRDLWFSRLANASNDAAASSTFQSVIEDVEFDEGLIASSKALTELRERACGRRLSIRLATFGYDASASSPTFTLGTMFGSIGPYLDGEPESFVFGRRFAPASGVSSWAGISYFSGVLDHASKALLLDLSNALPIDDIAGTCTDLGALSVGVLRDDNMVENTPVTKDNYLHLAKINYRAPHWLASTAGVVSVPLTDEQLQLAADHPLALVAKIAFNPGPSGMDDGDGVVAIRETTGGLFVGAEPAVHRIDPGEQSEVRCYASRYGSPLDAQQVVLRQVGRVPQQGGGGPNPDINAIPIPDMGFPQHALVLPDSVSTDQAGQASFQLQGSDPGNPRGYLDGQLYLIDYRLPGQGNGSRSPYDFVVVHLRNAYQVPDNPSWDADVKPIFTQFGNLYPIMSQRLIQLSDPASVIANRQLLELAFSRPITDSNYMPVTRDLSAAKQQMILKWLRGLAVTGDPSLQAELDAAAVGEPLIALPRPAAAPSAGESSEPADGSVDSKTRFAENFLRASRAPLNSSSGSSPGSSADSSTGGSTGSSTD